MRWVVMVLLAGCYGPTFPEGAACGTGDQCPGDLTCVNGVCVRGGVDARSPDDALELDAAVPQLRPSNGVDRALVQGLTTAIAITAATTIDTDTGEISGGLVRAAGTGDVAGITYVQLPAPAMGVPIAVFAFASLDVADGVTMRVTGSRAAVLLVAGDATIAGTLDGSAGCTNDRTCGGPGGGSGARSDVMAATGCGPGGTGTSATSVDDSGGGGGGGGTAGAAGGTADLELGGLAGAACIPMLLEPLVGGSGGGAGGPGVTMMPGQGGGGGGALQLSVLGELIVSGTILVSGAGGGGGAGDVANADAAAGGGGGAGGGILLEAPRVTVTASAVIAANGGGGGSGGTNAMPGLPGAAGGAGTTPATGGASVSSSGAGGTGGAAGAMPAVGGPSGANAGGGGGAVGVIAIRGEQRTIDGTVSPAANEAGVVLD